MNKMTPAHDVVFASLCSEGYASDKMHELFEECTSEKEWRDELMRYIADCAGILDNTRCLAYIICENAIAYTNVNEIHRSLFGSDWEHRDV